MQDLIISHWKELVSITVVLIGVQIGTVSVLKEDTNKRFEDMRNFILEYVNKTEIRDCQQEKDIIKLQCKE